MWSFKCNTTYITTEMDSLYVLFLVGGTRVFNPWTFLPNVHVRWRVGHTWPKYPTTLLPSVEVRHAPSPNKCLQSGFFCIHRLQFLRETSLYILPRFFHRPADGSEVMYDPVSVMNADILNYCQKESWCKLGFYLVSFFYYLYR